MATSIALVGGGIKGAVAAARYAASDDLVLLHVNFGQRSWSAEDKAVDALARSFPSAQAIRLDLPHLSQLEDRLGDRAGADVARASNRLDAARVGSRGLSPIALLGLMPVLCSLGVQSALRVGAARVVVGLSHLVGSPSVGLPLIEGQPARRREYVHSFNLMVEALLAQRSSVQIDVPLMDAGYAEVVRLAFHFELPVGELWSCEGPGPGICTRCGPCTTRAQAFADARLADPLAEPRSTTAMLGEG